ncbi:MAG: phosphotransferase family protein [Acidimicrobiales bacterium]
MVASGEGLRVVEPRVVGRGSNRIIWLSPAPIVARVMTGTAVLHADPRAWLARELDLGTFLAGTDAPIVPPTSSIDPGPHVSGGLWMSFWEHVQVNPADVSARELGESLRSLHDAMAGYRGSLAPRSAVVDEIDWLLTALADHAGDDEALLAQRDRLAPLLSQGDDEGQPLHGDASLSNLLLTSAGPRWSDFEDVCRGSPAWDVVGLVDDAGEHHGDAFAADVMAAYGRDIDQTLVQVVRDTHALYGTLWQRYRRKTSGAQP